MSDVILSLISQKGGVGKSTLARLVAVEAARAGWRVLIADLDAAQGTATQWHHRRAAAGIEPDLSVMRYRTVERALQDAAGMGADCRLCGAVGRSRRQEKESSMSEHQYFTVDETAFTIPDGGLAIYCGDAPRHNADGTTSHSLRGPLLIIPPDIWSDQQGIAEKVAKVLNDHAHVFFDSAKITP